MPDTDPDSDFRLRAIAIPAFGPSLLYGVSNGAILPVIALSARDLGASMAASGFIVALVGVGSLVSNIPAALFTARHGELRSMVAASLVSAVAMLLCIFASSIWALAAGVFMVGVASSVFLLARQGYMVDAVPVWMRARALSTLAGTMRIGVFVGPFAGAALIHLIDLQGAYWVALVAVLGAGAIAAVAPDMKTRPQPGRCRLPARVCMRCFAPIARSISRLGWAFCW
ncbi:major Facilitator Superfamily protein [Bordetella holmesii 70147]|nr:major Facilitator Superfamily protein [Bordetella holmesii 35009]EWM50418.1 major Facilitator Superfamily protein [Bordetella holmesii 70147]